MITMPPRHSGVCAAGIAIILMLSALSFAQDPPTSQGPQPEPNLKGQSGDAPPVGLPPPAERPGFRPGGISMEDLLLQKGTITMDEWIQIRAEQEYKAD